LLLHINNIYNLINVRVVNIGLYPISALCNSRRHTKVYEENATSTTPKSEEKNNTKNVYTLAGSGKK